MPPEVLALFKEQGRLGGLKGGRKGGLKGGKRSLETMTPEERKERARRAGLAAAARRKARNDQQAKPEV